MLQKCWGEALGRVYSTSRGLSCICVRLGHPGLDMDNLDEVGALCLFFDRLAATLVRLFSTGPISERRCSARGAGTSTRVRSRRGTARSSSASASTPRKVRAPTRPLTLASPQRVLSVFCQGLFSEPIFCTWGVLSLFSEPTFCGCGPDLHFAIVHGSSEMASPMMDIQHTKRLLGYAPRDGTAFASRPAGPKL